MDTLPLELLYYRNPTGLIAVSCDQGDTMILPSGKIMEPNKFWDDADGNLRDKLTAEQEAALQRIAARTSPTPVGEIVRNYTRNRKVQERLDGTVPETSPRKLSDDVLIVVADFD